MHLPATSQQTPMTVSYSSLSQLDKPELMLQERLPIRWPLCRQEDVCAPRMQTAPLLSIKACRSTTTACRVQLIYRQQAISAEHGFESSDLTSLVASTSSTTWASKSRREWPPPADRMCSDQIFDWCEVAHKKVSELSVNRRALVESHGVHDVFDDLETDAEQRDTPLVRVKTG